MIELVLPGIIKTCRLPLVGSRQNLDQLYVLVSSVHKTTRRDMTVQRRSSFKAPPRILFVCMQATILKTTSRNYIKFLQWAGLAARKLV